MGLDCTPYGGNTSPPVLILRNNDVYNPAGYNYLTVSAGTNDISMDPKLVSVQCRNYHLQPDSPCVNSGLNAAVVVGDTDIDGQPRVLPVGTTVDIGADESDGTLWPTPTPLIIRVDGVDGSDSNDGSDWSTAKKTVQSGIDAASAVGGEVWVKSGIYYERIILKPKACVYGGFAGTETVRTERNWQLNKTILDGQKASAVVSSVAGFDSSTIDGFTIRNGSGGGVSCTNSSPTISNNTITNNTSSTGAGISCKNSLSLISHNNIAGNLGMGIYSNGSLLTVSNNTISANNGGGIYTDWSINVYNNVIKGNTCATRGAGLYCGGGTAIITNNTFVGNSQGTVVTSDGGAVYISLLAAVANCATIS